MLNQLAALVGLAIASYTDLRSRTVPDTLTYSLLAFGLAYHAFLSFSTGSLQPIVLSLAGAALAFAFSYLLWRAGAWAGGDVKLLTAVGALVPALPGEALPILPFIAFLNSIILALPFVTVLVFIRTATRPDLQAIFKRMLISGTIAGLVAGAFWAGVTQLFASTGVASSLAVLVAPLIFFVPKPWRYGIAAAMLLLGMQSSSWPAILLGALSASLAWQAFTYGSKHAFRRRLPIKQLVDGMISAETLYLARGKVREFEPTLSQQLTLAEPKGVIVSANRAGGMDLADIAMLRKHGIKSLEIKESMPMVPLLALGVAAALFFGNLVLLVGGYL